MKVLTDSIEMATQGSTHIMDITDPLGECLARSRLTDGVLTVFVPGSTGGLTTIEYEPGLLKDLPALFEKLAPRDYPYHHHQTWHDDNGRSHVRSTIIGTSLVVPFIDGKLTLGTWQQIAVMNLDTSPRKRAVVLQVMGE